MNSRDDVARFDPVRLRLIEAMERRAAAHVGETRRLLDERIAALRSEPGGRMRIDAASDACTATSTRLPPGALAELVARMTNRASSRNGVHLQGVHTEPGVPVAATEIESLAYFRSTWSRLSTERRLKRSLATIPNNAGPLNSHQLVHRALQTMREMSPEYLHHFMTYVDALLWVDQANGGSFTAATPPMRSRPIKSVKNSGRDKSR
ncbi:MAG: DUF2894 domain-containing protein [Janthinobacterium lividum]